jgi:hypothetical protein
MPITRERWRDLCKQAAVEKDPYKLIRLCDEIRAILQRASNASQESSVSEKLTAADGPPA